MTFERGFLNNPAVKRELATWPDPAEKDGPRRCCADFATVTDCDGETDRFRCPVCDRRWSQPCKTGDFVPAIEPDAPLEVA